MIGTFSTKCIRHDSATTGQENLGCTATGWKRSRSGIDRPGGNVASAARGAVATAPTRRQSERRDRRAVL